VKYIEQQNILRLFNISFFRSVIVFLKNWIGATYQSDFAGTDNSARGDAEFSSIPFPVFTFKPHNLNPLGSRLTKAWSGSPNSTFFILTESERLIWIDNFFLECKLYDEWIRASQWSTGSSPSHLKQDTLFTVRR